MDVAERSRLEKLLGMLGSSFDGERANAARMIEAMAKKHGLTIPQLILGEPIIEHVVYRPARPHRPQPQRQRPQSSDVLDALKDIVASEAELEFVVTAWEYQFAADVSSKYNADYELSEKQHAVAARIIDKVETARRRSGGASA